MRITPLMTAAVHEAAHATVAHVLGFDVLDAHCQLHGENRRWAGAVHVATTAAQRRTVKYVALLAAGDIAVSMLRQGAPAPTARAGRWYFAQAWADLPEPEIRTEGARHLPTLPTQSDRENASAAGLTKAQNAEAMRMAGRILGGHWRAVTDVADALIEQGQINGAELRAMYSARNIEPVKLESARPAKRAKRIGPHAESTPRRRGPPREFVRAALEHAAAEEARRRVVGGAIRC